MKNSTESIVSSIIKVMSAADQMRKVVADKDISVTIDGKDYPITKKKVNKDEIVELKSKLYDLELIVKKLISVIEYFEDDLSEEHELVLATSRGFILDGI